MDISPDARKHGTHTSGGHATLRTLVNSLIATQLNEIIKLCNQALPDHHDLIYIIAPGDKYQKTTTILDGVYLFDVSAFYPFHDHMTREEMDQVSAMREQFELDAEEIRNTAYFERLTNYERNIEFLELHDTHPDANHDAIALLRTRNKVVHKAIRPNDTEYDRRYHINHLDDCLQKTWRPGHIDHEYVVGYIQDHDYRMSRARVMYYMTDVHYYLSDWRPANQKETDYFNCVGGNFFPLPGVYNLPFNEGTYIISGDSMIRFRPRRSGEWYQHPLVTLTNPVMTLNFGWYSLAYASGHPRDFKLYRYAPTGFNTSASVQSTWICRQLEHLKGTKSADMIRTTLAPCWTPETTE